MDVPDEENAPEVVRGEGYHSPALLRLKEPPRPTAPIRRIAQAGRQLPDEAVAARFAAIEDQIGQLHQQQLAFFENLREAHAAFSRLVDRVEELADRVRELRGG